MANYDCQRDATHPEEEALWGTVWIRLMKTNPFFFKFFYPGLFFYLFSFYFICLGALPAYNM